MKIPAKPASPAGQPDDFFLPDLCKPQSILFLVLVAELLLMVMVLLQSRLVDFDWIKLGLASLLTQWIVLVSAALLCYLRPVLSTVSTAKATTTGFCLIMLITCIFSVLAEWLLLEDVWQLSNTGSVVRNLIVAAVMTGIAFRYFFLQHRLRRQEQAELSSRIQALQSRIRPHFLFNSMNIIASLISVDPETAEEVVEDLSILFRASLNDSADSQVPLSEEIDLCDKYVHIESLRLEDRLDVDWQIATDIAPLRIPLLTLQPILENAIYHGIQPNPAGGTVTVSIAEDDGNVLITVRNPLPPLEPSHKRGNRMALENIRHRFDAMYGERARVESGESGDEYVTTLRFPKV